MIERTVACANHILNRDATFAQWVCNGAEELDGIDELTNEFRQ